MRDGRCLPSASLLRSDWHVSLGKMGAKKGAPKIVQWSAVRVTPSGNPRDLNFSRTVAGITIWFWVTIEGYLIYLLPKFEDLIPTSLGDIAI